jgi:hypothetical protein
MPHPVIPTVVDVVAVAEAVVVSVTEDEEVAAVAVVVDVVALVTVVDVEVRAVVVEARPTVEALETSKARSKLSKFVSSLLPHMNKCPSIGLWVSNRTVGCGLLTSSPHLSSD